MYKLDDLITTTDKFGDLMPSYVGTDLSEQAISEGLVKVKPNSKIYWETLTDLGKQLKMELSNGE